MIEKIEYNIPIRFTNYLINTNPCYELLIKESINYTSLNYDEITNMEKMLSTGKHNGYVIFSHFDEQKHLPIIKGLIICDIHLHLHHDFMEYISIIIRILIGNNDDKSLLLKKVSVDADTYNSMRNIYINDR